MVVILFVGLALLWVKQVVASGQLKDHASQTPNVSGCVILAIKDDFGRSILPCLDHIRVVLVHVAGIPHVNNLQIEH